MPFRVTLIPSNGIGPELASATCRDEQAATARVDTALRAAIAEGRTVTYDMGGDAGTSVFADAIIERIGAFTAATS